MAYHFRQVDELAIEDDLSGIEAGDVEHVVDEVGEPVDLPIDHLARTLVHGGARRRHGEQRGRRLHGAERVAQLVSQHGEELVLGGVGALGFGPRFGFAQQGGAGLVLARGEPLAGAVERHANGLGFVDVQARFGALCSGCSNGASGLLQHRHRTDDA